LFTIITNKGFTMRCAAIVFLLACVSWADNNTLGSDYNLGRVTGPDVFFNSLDGYVMEDIGLLLVNTFHGQGGVEDHISIGWTGMALSLMGEVGMFGITVPEFDLHARLGDANRLSVMVMPLNLTFVAASEDVATGFDMPFYMLNVYGWDLLTNGGEIRVPADQLEHAFLFGPLLNRTQLRIDLDFAHTIRVDGGMPGLFMPSLRAAYGLADNLQLGAEFGFRNQTPEYHNNDYNDIMDVSADKGMVAGGTLAFRHGHMGAGLGYRLDKAFSPEMTKQDAYATMNLLFGERGVSIREVGGNWDGSFTPVLGKHQLVNSSIVRYEHDDFGRLESNRLTLGTSARFGVTDWFTAGAHYTGNTLFQGPENNQHQVRLGVAAMNIPLRTEGPSQVPKFDYVYGLHPGPGQVRAVLSYRLPFGKEEIYYEPRVVMERMSSMMQGGIGAFEQLFLLEEFDPADLAGKEWGTPSTLLGPASDMQLTVSVGLGTKVILSNSFEGVVETYVNDQYYLDGYDPDYDPYYDNPYYDPYWDLYYFKAPDYNFIYANRLSIAFGDRHRSLATLHGTIVGQSDDNVSGREKFDFMFGFMYQGAW
jgi:hypothetical protein